MADKSQYLDATERVVKVMKEATLLALVGYVAWYLVPFIPKWTAKLEGAQISEVNLAGVSLKLSQTEQKLEQALKSTSPEKSKTDEAVSPDKKLVIEALESVQALKEEAVQLQPATKVAAKPAMTSAPATSVKSEPFWVYLGVATNGSIAPKNFRISTVPSSGQLIEATTEVYKRSSSPKFKEGDGWYLGNAVGVVRSGQKVVVRRMERIPSTQSGSEVVWAEVELAR